MHLGKLVSHPDLISDFHQWTSIGALCRIWWYLSKLARVPTLLHNYVNDQSGVPPYSATCDQQDRLWPGRLLWSHPTPEYLCVSLEWPTFTHTWRIQTCNLIKTHCPFLYFEETILSTCLLFSHYFLVSFHFIYFIWPRTSVSLSLLWQPKIMNSRCDIFLSLVDCVGGL